MIKYIFINIMSKKLYFTLITIAFLVCSCTNDIVIDKVKNTSNNICQVIDESRLVCVELYNNIRVYTFDIYADSIKNIFNELKKNDFKLYDIGCYNPRNIRNKNTKSLHAYASAIDVNTKQNPYIDVYKNTIIPAPDKKEQSINKDGYLNRNKIRPGMITEKEAQIFYKNGFTQWGGSTAWKGCPDYMHFQVSLAIAKIVTKLPKEEAKIFWNKYLQNPQKIILDPFFNQDINEKDIKLDLLLKRIDKIINNYQ